MTRLLECVNEDFIFLPNILYISNESKQNSVPRDLSLEIYICISNPMKVTGLPSNNTLKSSGTKSHYVEFSEGGKHYHKEIQMALISHLASVTKVHHLEF